jgi:uncharacterized membrane protein
MNTEAKRAGLQPETATPGAWRIPAITILSVLGLAVSLYLLTVHWGWWTAVCLGVGDCEAVNTSRFSELLGVPVALLGALAYVAQIALCGAIRWNSYALLARRALFIIAVIGVVFSAYLTYLELFVIHAICPWCVTSAILLIAIMILSGMEMFGAETE